MINMINVFSRYFMKGFKISSMYSVRFIDRDGVMKEVDYVDGRVVFIRTECLGSCEN